MKMEVLSVQNQFQNQFGVIGSPKVKDWTSPLTVPTSHSGSSNNNHQVIIEQNNSQKKLIFNKSKWQKEHNQPNQCDEQYKIDEFYHHNHNVEQQQTYPDLPALVKRLQCELREAKARHLECTEVLLPPDLLARVAAQMIEMSELEPCGIKGCSIYIEFEEEPGNTRRIASMKVDPNMVSTFELYLTIKQSRSAWITMLPQFLQRIATRSTIIISPEYELIKNKLFR